ncbi:hypothetical protein HPB50_000485 [Hyalomma asiaticum]|uniref:Uncharacterized protein n=1 Tax=Hyalomma asiaticum TaxID=266040 RepID=A0ACB7RPQ8_HYAAI|nr:hypothetical protein HPB50_000485 [Hyalomma asiaticum]
MGQLWERRRKVEGECAEERGSGRREQAAAAAADSLIGKSRGKSGKRSAGMRSSVSVFEAEKRRCREGWEERNPKSFSIRCIVRVLIVGMSMSVSLMTSLRSFSAVGISLRMK